MNDSKRGPGRPKKYKNKAKQMRAQRAKKKQAGYRDIHASIPDEYKKILDQFCSATKLSIAELICYLLECAQKHNIPDINKPHDFQPH